MAVYQTRPFQRGDVYYISYSNSVGSEQGVGRPGIIVSSQKGCDASPVLNVVYLTTSETRRFIGINVEINSMKRRGWAECNQIATVDRVRFQTYKTTITPEELAAVDKALSESLGIPYGIVSDTSESDRLKKELEQQKQEVEKLKLSSLDVTVERDYYKGLYEAALRRFVDKRLDQDLVEQKPVVEKKQAPAMIPDEPENKELVDLNSCSVADLKRLGLREDVIVRVIAARPFKTVDDLKYVHGITTIAYRLLGDRVCVRPVVVEKPTPVVSVTEKLNLNTATAKEIMAIGVNQTAAYSITGYRNKNGKFTSIDDLVNIPRISKGMVERIRDKVCL